MLMMHY